MPNEKNRNEWRCTIYVHRKMRRNRPVENFLQIVENKGFSDDLTTKIFGRTLSSSSQLRLRDKQMGISLGMKDARLRLRGDKKNKLGQCFNCAKPATSRELQSCGSPDCNKECRKVFLWVRRVMRSLDRKQSGAYVTYQMGQGGE